jgi:hypothetical protein
MSASIRDITTEYIQAVADGRLDRVEALLHPDLVFDGTVPAPRGKASYVDALRVLTTSIVRSDIRDIVVEGDRAFVLYDFVTDTPAGSVLSGELLSFDDGLIRTVTLLFDWRRWPQAMKEIERRAGPVPTPADA